ncbi:hypothetical protein [Pseudarthrobacter sp. BIM B-2242]|uniref:hypothetical protein n=1 Tax=Pseudarthrobacter sp. BIM B-2242 TaxID=2772401 RepID=UPI00168B239C|nr:hypothetical protein [Pseudarthrobacter sp. BIM B-2242]QOD06150.1 hypothetical protein IDT60_21565 [Pseudarthrobacter sp. BIM B-2242]
MGHWDRQHGEIVLPSAEFAAVRQAVQKATHEHQSKVFDETQAFWKGLTRKEQTDPAAYTAALQKYVDAKHKQLYPPQSYSSWSRPAPAPFTEEFVDDVQWRLGLPPGGKPARVLKSDLPFPTNRTTSFPAGEGSVSFDKDTSTVRWSTSENRGATERAHNSAAGTAFFDRLKTVKWTRNTGGIIMGNNEYAEEAGRGDECSTAYGPIGAAQEPSSCQEYTDSKGNRVTRADLMKLQSELWDAQRKLQNRMAKATAAAGRGKTTAASNRGSFASYGHSEPTFRL